SCAVLALGGMLLGAFCAAPLIAAISQIQARLKGLRLLDNFALQICRMGLACLVLYILFCLALAAYLLQLPLEFWPQVFNTQAVYPPLAGLLWGGAILGLLVLYWKSLKQQKWLRLTLALLSALGFWFFVLSSLNLKLWVLKLPVEASATSPSWQQLLLPEQPYLFWSLLGQFLCLALGACGLGAMLYFLLRRTKEDFGRDYYRFAQHLAAKWSLVFILQIPFWALVFFRLRPWQKLLQNTLEQFLVAGALLFLVAGIALGLRLLRSQHPMRLKLSPVGCALLAWLGWSCLCLSYAWVLLYP
ncbi:MAG: hypothetical protein ACQEQX_04230, partial [Thermodesulfobacteriota bacterium]